MYDLLDASKILLKKKYLYNIMHKLIDFYVRF